MNLNSHGGLGPLITHHYNSGWVVIIVFDDHESKTDSWQITNLSEVCYRRFFTLFACYFLPHCWWPFVRFHPVSILQRSISPRLSSCHVLPVPFLPHGSPNKQPMNNVVCKGWALLPCLGCEQICPNDQGTTFDASQLYILVGGWTNPFEKICSSNWESSPGRGEHWKSIWNYHLVYLDYLGKI